MYKDEQSFISLFCLLLSRFLDSLLEIHILTIQIILSHQHLKFASPTRRHDVNPVNVIPPSSIMNPNKNRNISATLAPPNFNNEMISIQPSDLILSGIQNNRNQKLFRKNTLMLRNRLPSNERVNAHALDKPLKPRQE